jgi:hypothetical protein
MNKYRYLAIPFLTALLVLATTIAITQIVNKNNIYGNEKMKATDTDVSTSDDPWQQLSNIVKEYNGQNGMHYKGTIKLIDDNGNEEKVLETQEVEYMIFNNEYYYHLGDLEMINKSNFLMVVDNSNKSITVSKKEGIEVASRPFDIKEFQKLLVLQHGQARVSQNGENKIITIDSIDHPLIQGYSIYYSPKTFRISKMIIGMVRPVPLEDNELPDGENSIETNDEEGIPEDGYSYYLEMVYDTVESMAIQGNSFAPENKFILMNKGQVAMKEAYKDYELINRD